MSERFPDRAALRDKIEWEGGILEALDYGIKAEDMPEGDTELINAWAALQAARDAMVPLGEAVEQLLDAADEPRKDGHQ